MKTYGAYFFRIFCLHSLRFFPVQNLPHNVFQLTQKIDQPKLPQLVRRFLYSVLYPNLPTPIANLAPDDLPLIPKNLRVYIYNSARVVYFAPSDVSGVRGMHQERIRSTSSWYGGHPQCDCVFVGNADSPDAPGFKSLLVARVFLFFFFQVYQYLLPLCTCPLVLVLISTEGT